MWNVYSKYRRLMMAKLYICYNWQNKNYTILFCVAELLFCQILTKHIINVGEQIVMQFEKDFNYSDISAKRIMNLKLLPYWKWVTVHVTEILFIGKV